MMLVGAADERRGEQDACMWAKKRKEKKKLKPFAGNARARPLAHHQSTSAEADMTRMAARIESESTS